MRLHNNPPQLILEALLICSCMSMSRSAPAQLCAGATVALSATLPSSVTVSDTLVPVVIVVANGRQVLSNSSVVIKWNLEVRSATGLRIVGALVSFPLPATSLEVRTASALFRPLGQNRIVLLHKFVTAAGPKGEMQTGIQLQLKDDALRNLSDGIYQGWLKLEAEIL